MNWIRIAYLNNYDLENWEPIEHQNGAACFDLRAAIRTPITIDDRKTIKVPLGIKVELPPTHCMEIYPRSGFGSKGLTMTNSVGNIDPNYRGEVKVPLIHAENGNYITINPGDRVVQAKLVPITKALFIQCEEWDMSKTDRGNAGFGEYTGKQ